MRSLWCGLLALALLLPTGTAAAESTKHAVAVEVDGEKLAADAYLVDGRTVVPLRAIFERLNATIEWNEEEQSVTAVKGSTTVKLAIGRTDATAGERTVTLDVPPMLINGSTYVPLRFVSEAMGAGVTFDSERSTAVVSTGNSCAQGGGQIHSGTIRPGGETWGVCGSPHFVTEDFFVEGKDSPILTIEAGAVVRFENQASLRIGEHAPGGLVIAGTAQEPVVLTADTAGAQPGFWDGIRFFGQTIKGRATIDYARIEYAGDGDGAIYVEAGREPLEITLRHTTVKNSLTTGLLLYGNAGLSEASKKLTITGTVSSSLGGGMPIMTGVTGAGTIPEGDYTGNEIDEILLSASGGSEIVTKSQTWRNAGVPYRSEINIWVEGPTSPILTIEPGVATLWNDHTSLRIGEHGRGGIRAVGTLEKPILFTSDMEQPGSWMGIYFGSQAVAKSVQLQNAVVEYAQDGIQLEKDLGPVITDSAIRNNEEYGVRILDGGPGKTDYRSGWGNAFSGNGQDQNFDE
jgi:hypothetical protein